MTKKSPHRLTYSPQRIFTDLDNLLKISMGRDTLTVSKTGQKKIKQALDRMGWKVKAEDRRPIVTASQYLIDQYAEVHGLKENDAAWLRDFEHVFRLEKQIETPKDKESKSEKLERIERQNKKHRDRINEVKLQIVKNRQTTYLKSLKHLIDEGELYAKGISYGNWSKFAAQTQRNAIDSRAFKAYCHILGLDWQEVAEGSDPVPPLKRGVRGDCQDCDGCIQGAIANEDFDRLREIHGNLCHLLKQISADPNLVEKHLNRQISQLLLLVEKHGGKDWQEWQDYQELEEQWPVLCQAIEWCIEQDRSSDVKLFWQYVKCYSYIQGYQGDRQTQWQNQLHWTEWLIETAKNYQDWSMLAQGLFDQAWTLTLMGKSDKLEKADQLFQEAKTLNQHTDLSFQIDLAIHFAFLLLRQQQYAAAKESLQEAETLLTSLQLGSQISQRSLFKLDYYQGQISFYTKDYQQAKDYFHQALDRANQLNWQRAIALCKSWLGNVAVEQGDLDTAEPLLQQCLEIAQNNQDNCRIAFCYQSLAFFFKKQGNLVRAKENAKKAISLFNQLGLVREARVTKKDIL